MIVMYTTERKTPNMIETKLKKSIKFHPLVHSEENVSHLNYTQ